MSGVWGSKSRTSYNALVAINAKRWNHRQSFSTILWKRSTRIIRHSYIPISYSIISTIYPWAWNSTVLYSTQCDQCTKYGDQSKSSKSQSTTSLIKQSPPDTLKRKSFLQKVYKSLRILSRVIQLLVTLAPLVLLYPIRYSLLTSSSSLDNNNIHEKDSPSLTVDRKGTSWSNDAVKSYLSLCLKCVEYSGAAIVKLMQWGSSRPDLFGNAFCSVFEKLQDHTTPHSMQDTISSLQNAYGQEWNTHIYIGNLIGSGCIGQVYKGQVHNAQGSLQDVAIKVMHPNIHQNIETDLDILRLLANVAENVPFRIGEHMKWLNVSGIVEEFSRLLTLQLDFRIEARNLNRFNINFSKDEHVSFPQLVEGYQPTQSVLIETFCEGTPIMKFVAQHRDNMELRSRLCDLGIRTVCKMIFDHNFIHGKLGDIHK